MLAGDRAADAALGAAHTAVHAALHTLFMLFLRGKDTREPALAWVAACLNANAERAKLAMDPDKAASHGFAVNLAVVLLRACEPFADPASGRAWGKLDASYVAAGRIDWSGDTRLAADEGQARAWAERVVGERAAGAAPPYHFVCECFWATAKATALGPVRLADETRALAQRLDYTAEDADELDAAADAAAGTAAEGPARAQAERVRRALQSMQAYAALLAAALRDVLDAGPAVAYWRLVAAWLLRLASPAAAAGGPPEVPLPPPTEAWTCLPECLLTDMVEVLRSVPPEAFETIPVGEVLRLVVVLVASPGHVRNPYSRAQLVQLLHAWLLPSTSGQGAGGAVGGGLAALVRDDSLAQAHLVRSLMVLYADIEHTSRNAAFFEKFGTRLAISQVLGEIEREEKVGGGAWLSASPVAAAHPHTLPATCPPPVLSLPVGRSRPPCGLAVGGGGRGRPPAGIRPVHALPRHRRDLPARRRHGPPRQAGGGRAGPGGGRVVGRPAARRPGGAGGGCPPGRGRRGGAPRPRIRVRRHARVYHRRPRHGRPLAGPGHAGSSGVYAQLLHEGPCGCAEGGGIGWEGGGAGWAWAERGGNGWHWGGIGWAHAGRGRPWPAPHPPTLRPLTPTRLGPDRRKLKVVDADAVHWRPKELLTKARNGEWRVGGAQRFVATALPAAQPSHAPTYPAHLNTTFHLKTPG